MSSVQRLLSAFIEEHRAGGDADPSAYLERVPYRERLAAWRDTPVTTLVAMTRDPAVLRLLAEEML